MLANLPITPTTIHHPNFRQLVSESRFKIIRFQCSHNKTSTRPLEYKNFPVVDIKSMGFWYRQRYLFHHVISQPQIV